MDLLAVKLTTLDINPRFKNERNSIKIEWYWAPVYAVCWFLLFYVAVIPSYYSYPEALLVRDERLHPDEFIGERAEMQLLELSSIGVKLAGTVENEVHAVQFLLKEIEKIKAQARQDLYDIDVDVQYSSGDFMLWGMICSYHNVSNVIVKLSPKNTQSESYLLVNSHFDSEVASPAAGDAGVMIVVMLETLRVISRSERELKNPIVFLMNGAEESNLLASHGFITQHKWARFCKAVINLDSSGSGGKEILFQTGPNHPWLIKYYKRAAKHPFATTAAEELFQNNFIPSDTDFRIFRDHGGVPGLDMAHVLNGYVYHTKYDNFRNLGRGAYQTTGDNVLALTWALANAKELTNPEDYAEGHTVYFDFLGWFLIAYTETDGIIINVIISCSALIFTFLSVFLMKPKYEDDHRKKPIYMEFFIIILVQTLTVLASIGLIVLLAVIMDALGLTQTWYSETWLIFGLYFCPMFFAMTFIPALYIQWTKKKTSMELDNVIECFMHSYCIILAIVCIVMTGLGIRSAFFFMIAVFFYTVSVVLNLAFSKFIHKNYLLAIHLLCQIMPFWFYTYMAFTFLIIFVPMQGRDGPTSKPEILISLFVAVFSLHFAGFILPILHKFRKCKTWCSLFVVVWIVYLIIAATPAGFPYRKDVSPQRFYVLHMERTIRDFSGLVVKNDTGFYVQPVDTRPGSLDDTTFKNERSASWLKKECDSELFCGLPLYSSRWMKWKKSAKWIPASAPNLVIPTKLELVSKDYENNTHIRYQFSLKSADRVVIYTEPLDGAKIMDWSFNKIPLEENFETPYFFSHVYSMDESPLEFWMLVQKSSAAHEGANIRLGIGVHFLYHTHTYTKEFNNFLTSFPDWAYPTNWVSSYEGWQF